MPFQRPTLPYNNISLPNSNRYRDLSNTNQPPTGDMLDTDFDYIIDSMNVLQFDMGQIEAGILIGSDNPANANLLPTTDGAGNISWIKVGQQQYEAASITNVALAAGAVLTGNIGAGAITTPLLGPQVVTAANIANNTITGTQLAADSVITSKIVDQNVTGEKIANHTITGGNIANQTITAAKIGNQALTNVQIAGAFFRATVSGGIITQIYNQNVIFCIRNEEGIYSVMLNNTGTFTTTIPIGVFTYGLFNTVLFINKSSYVISVTNGAGIPTDPLQISFGILYIP